MGGARTRLSGLKKTWGGEEKKKNGVKNHRFSGVWIKNRVLVLSKTGVFLGVFLFFPNGCTAF